MLSCQEWLEAEFEQLSSRLSVTRHLISSSFWELGSSVISTRVGGVEVTVVGKEVEDNISLDSVSPYYNKE